VRGVLGGVTCALPSITGEAVYLEGNEAERCIFALCIAPLKDLVVTTLTMRGIGRTDHTSFDEVDIPAFQFMQDKLDRDSRAHHSNSDTSEQLRPEADCNGCGDLCVQRRHSRPDVSGKVLPNRELGLSKMLPYQTCFLTQLRSRRIDSREPRECS
jgi:hypothetical protein